MNMQSSSSSTPGFRATREHPRPCDTAQNPPLTPMRTRSRRAATGTLIETRTQSTSLLLPPHPPSHPQTPSMQPPKRRVVRRMSRPSKTRCSLSSEGPRRTRRSSRRTRRPTQLPSAARLGHCPWTRRAHGTSLRGALTRDSAHIFWDAYEFRLELCARKQEERSSGLV